tara:strand:- start:1846 stop:2133 length:288 start_codon:yes stop_codon:yes gene_type:complete
VLKKKIKKIDIIKDLNKKTGFSLNFSKKILDDLISILLKNLKSGNLSLKNIGTFKVVKKKERKGRNPKTKEEFIIFARKSIIFKPSKKIIDSLNN